jgi:putative transposase
MSMGSTGVCWDNTVAETFFATLKKELVYRTSWLTRRELISEIFESIEAFYNPRRRHPTLGYLSPVEFKRTSPLAGLRPSLPQQHLRQQLP